MTLSDEEIYQTLKASFSPYSIDIPLIKIGGYNNTNYSVSISGKKYFVKVANRNEKLVGSSLQNEVECMKKLVICNICPNLVFYDPQNSIMVTEFIEGNFNFNQSNAKNRYIKLLHTLHHSNIHFENEFCPFKTIQKYTEVAIQRGVYLPEFLTKEIVRKILALKKEELFLEKAPCHLDPQFYNILDTGSRLYLVDWEFAAMSEPLFDLASMCASEEFSDDEMKEILTLYLEGTPSDTDWKRFYILRIIADLRMCLFCYLYTSITSTSPQTYKEFAETFLKQIKLRFSAL